MAFFKIPVVVDVDVESGEIIDNDDTRYLESDLSGDVGGDVADLLDCKTETDESSIQYRATFSIKDHGYDFKDNRDIDELEKYMVGVYSEQVYANNRDLFNKIDWASAKIKWTPPKKGKMESKVREVTTTAMMPSVVMPNISRTLRNKLSDPSRDLSDYNLECPSCGTTLPSYLNNYPKACPMCGGELFERKTRGKVREQEGVTLMPGTRIRCKISGNAGTVNKVQSNGAVVFWDDGSTELCLIDSIVANDDNDYDPLVGPETDPVTQEPLDTGYGTALSGLSTDYSLGVRMGNVGERRRTRGRSFKERVRESIMSPLGDDGIEALRTIVHDGTASKVHGVMIDLFSASVILTVYNALNDGNRDKFKSMSMSKAIEKAHLLYAKVK
jgi:predicted RNA-binding Zn-ribbon protein involved in translation (DUF1610 family)